MTGSMVMAPARSARVAMQHAGTSRRNVRGRIIAVMIALALAWCGFGALTAQRAQSDTGATQVTSYIVRPGTRSGHMLRLLHLLAMMYRKQWMS